MPPAGISAQGTLLARQTNGAGAFTDVSELRDFTPPALSRNALETTTHNEDDDAYIPGIRRHGDMTFTLNFVPDDATQDHTTGLQKSWFDGSRDVYRITFPDGTMWLFSGYVTNFAPDAPVDDVLTVEVTVRPTGRHDWVAP